MRWGWLLLSTACAQHGVAPERSAEPAPEVRPDEAREPTFDGGCDLEAPAWLIADPDRTLPPLPVAPTGPGIPVASREPRKHPEQWLPHLDDHAVVAPDVEATACRSQHFLEGDERAVATILYGRDDRARTLTEREDTGTDGRIDETRTWTRDSTGALVTFTRRRPRRVVCGKAVPGEHETHGYVYDRFGMHLRTDLDHEGDGVVDAHADWRAIRYDGDGLPILVVQFDGTGLPRIIERFRWGADGRLVERLVQDASGKLLEAERHEFGAYGQRRFTSEYHEGQGWKTSRLRYDDNGDVVRMDVDLDADCFADERTVLTYHPGGALATSTTRAGDDVTVMDDYRYDEAGRLVRFSRKRGTMHDAEFHEHAYDADGRVTAMRIRQARGRPGSTSAHVFEDEQRTRYDDAGRRIEQQLRHGTFGPDETVKWTHNCRRRYRTFPALDPRDDPEFAQYCMEDFE